MIGWHCYYYCMHMVEAFKVAKTLPTVQPKEKTQEPRTQDLWYHFVQHVTDIRKVAKRLVKLWSQCGVCMLF